MEYIHLGRSGLSVSRLCLGTMNFGPLTAPADAHVIMDYAHEIGINFFDTANRYGGGTTPPGQVAGHDEAHSGWTEEIIGEWFAAGGGRRERTVLATKLYGAMGDWPNDGKLSALNIRRACDASLCRLQTDYIDLYQMHHVDRDTPWDEIRARSSTSARPTSPAGTSPRPTTPLPPAGSSAWSASSPSTTC
jgi:aryl-alcohol dehydrogenase-like predicted oxidoreductase